MEYPQRKLHRLKYWDYSQCGYYYITICTKDKRKILCDIRQNGLETQMIPTKMGRLVQENWERIPSIYPNVKTDLFCIMPNHIHGILIIEENTMVTLSEILRGFKSVTTRAYNQTVPAEKKNTLWQSSYYDEIIRDEDMLQNVRAYIFGNPSKWMEDSLYVE